MSGPGSADTARWRDQLVDLGFSDDGELLRGPVQWTHPDLGAVVAKVEMDIDDAFPFAAPHVRLVAPGAPLEVTFHVDRPQAHDAGNLCLWEEDWAVDQAPWRDPAQLLKRIAGWLESTAAGWPDDNAGDLERYLERQDGLVLYDAAEIAGLTGVAVRSTPGPITSVTVVTAKTRRIGDRRERGRLNRKDRRLTWIDDLGAIPHPVRNWADIRAALGAATADLERGIAFGVINRLLLRYTRGVTPSVLVVNVRRVAGDIEVKASESADTSLVTRQMRAGIQAPELAAIKIAVVGCGAVGSFATDLLYRSGFRNITLRDHERLRPGNVVRHLAGHDMVGQMKVHAVRECLKYTDADVNAVETDTRRLLTLTDAVALLRDHHVVLDATGNARASSLLSTAAATIGPGSGHTVISACLQREGAVARIDRFPQRNNESYLPALPLLDERDQPREKGCGSPVSRTPPASVMRAAELACRFVIDEATRTSSLPASFADVIHAQPEAPYDRVGLVSSDDDHPIAQAS